MQIHNEWPVMKLKIVTKFEQESSVGLHLSCHYCVLNALISSSPGRCLALAKFFYTFALENKQATCFCNHFSL